MRSKITIGKIKKELNELSTIDELGSRLSMLESLTEEEAEKIKEEIINKIVQISTDEVEKLLAEKKFSKAFETIDKALQFDHDNEKLLALRERVNQEKVAFEEAEQKRMEQAIEAAAREDLKNRTEAVEITDFSIELDEYGDLYIHGEVKNKATVGISLITVNYTIYNKDGTYIDDGFIYVYPDYLAPGEKGTFEDVYYGIYEDVTVQIDNVTWYLD